MAPSIIAKALPLVSQRPDCSDFSLTIAPYLHQFAELPARLLATRSLDGLRELYVTTNPVVTALTVSVIVAQIAFVVSTINKNYSQIDRVWSILPAVYNGHYWYWAYLNGLRSQRLDIIAGFTVCWSARLTHNYWRKGGYQKGSEDYRWELVRTWFNAPTWVVFNYVVVSLFQSLLLAFITTPTYVLLLISRLEPEITPEDALFPQILAACLVIEFYSDNSQWDFHQAKKQYQKTAKAPEGYEAKELDRGFNTTGMWARSRHPNFAAEQGIWVAMYQWGCFQSGSLMNWTFVGPLFYLLVFQASTPITEHLSAKKYPEYKAYQRYVGKFIPKFTGPKWSDYVKEQEKKAAVAAGGAEKTTKQSKKLR